LGQFVKNAYFRSSQFCTIFKMWYDDPDWFSVWQLK